MLVNGFYVHRAYRDLLKHDPDVVFVEFAVNDQKTKILENTYEMLLRNILNYPTHEHFSYIEGVAGVAEV